MYSFLNEWSWNSKEDTVRIKIKGKDTKKKKKKLPHRKKSPISKQAKPNNNNKKMLRVIDAKWLH